MIKAPYNFVPLSDKVVFPDEWSSRISHDIPFSDGVSGLIHVTLTSKTPIFVRNGHTREEADPNSKAYNSEVYESFSRMPPGSAQAADGKYFLPATSVKGMVRSALEMMSFGKIRLDENMRFAQREWDNKYLYTLRWKQQDLHCGWLRPGDDGGYMIVDCGSPARIAHPAIDDYVGFSLFESKFSRDKDFSLNRMQKIGSEDIDPKTAYYKYRLIEKNFALSRLKDIRFSEDKDYCTKTNRNRLKVDPKGKIVGTIVFTGQPDKWKTKRGHKAGKFYEFVFKKPTKGIYPIGENEIRQYEFIYADSPDWKYAKEKMLNDTGIPVFFRLDPDGHTIKDWGLAFLYKLPYERTPYQTLPKSHTSDRPDMADCIFGYTGNEASLKGRVQFNHFISTDARQLKSCKLVLGSPKASYYPIYIEQGDNGRNGFMSRPYKTYNDGRVKGWKRYLLRAAVTSPATGSQVDNDKVYTVLHPLAAGATFKGIIRFHNLKPVELGALLSALTLHGNERKAFHQIGMAKPYGYGKISLNITGIDIKPVGASATLPKVYPDYMKIFERYMDSKLNELWRETPLMKELLTIASNDVPDPASFEYMALDPKTGRNDFAEAKKWNKNVGKRSEYLPYYSELLRKRNNARKA